MKLIRLQEQIAENTCIHQDFAQDIIPYMKDGEDIVFSVCRKDNPKEMCLSISRSNDSIFAKGSYFIGLDWLSTGNVALQVNPKMNDGYEIDYIRMLNDSLTECENYNHLNDLVTIYFNKPSIKVSQQQDFLSIFLITEYLNILGLIVKKGLKKSFYMVKDNLQNKVKGRIIIDQNIRTNIVKGRITSNVCKYQVYGIDSPENRILKLAFRFCVKQLEIYKHALNTDLLNKKVRFIRPHFDSISDEICIRTIKSYKGNPVYRDYNQAIEFAQLLLHRYSYDITSIGQNDIPTPPFWIDTSKLFELYVFHHLRRVFTGKNEISYHIRAHFQELDYLLKPELWPNPYVIDAKYKPSYKECKTISKEDAREVSGYARLNKVYELLGLDEESAIPIKCLIIYPDQSQNEFFTFTREKEPEFERISGYVRLYKVGIKLPHINNKL